MHMFSDILTSTLSSGAAGAALFVVLMAEHICNGSSQWPDYTCTYLNFKRRK